MHRVLGLGLVALLAAGCQVPPDRVPLKALPDDGPPLPYAELLTRARVQATAANEAFYVNNWSDLEETARGLEQTARYLTKATDVPAKQKDALPVMAGDLGKDALQLRDLARDKDVKQANELLQRIHLRVRELRLEN